MAGPRPGRRIRGARITNRFPGQFRRPDRRDTDPASDSQNILPALLGESPTGRESLVEHAGVLALRKGNLNAMEVRGQKVANTAKSAKSNGASPESRTLRPERRSNEAKDLAAENAAKVTELAAELEKIKAAGRYPEPLPAKPDPAAEKLPRRHQKSRRLKKGQTLATGELSFPQIASGYLVQLGNHPKERP